jgi:hypothetical protein
LEEEFTDADEETPVDTLEGLRNLADMLAEVCRSMLGDQAMVSALRGRIGDMLERCGRIEARARKKRGLVCAVMERVDLKKVRVRVRAAEAEICREGCGSGHGLGLTPGDAYESAIKEAETTP